MTTIGIIPARYASTRFPGKVLAPIHGYPMVHHVYRRVSKCTSVDEVIIATDSPRVVRECSLLEDSVILTGSDHESGTDRVAEVARNMEGDLVLNIQADEPELDPRVVDQLTEYMKAHPDILMGTVGSTAFDSNDLTDLDVVKVIEWDGLALDFYRALPSELPTGNLLRHIGLYAYRRDFLFQFAAQPPGSREREHRLEQLRALDMGIRIGLITVQYISRAVDTPADLERIESDWND